MESKVVETNEVSLKEVIDKLREYFLYLIAKWKLIIVAGCIGLILGLTFSILKKTIYTATLSFALEDGKSGGNGLGGALGLASSFGFDIDGGGGNIFTGSNLTELFKSRAMVEKTLLTPVIYKEKKMSLAEMYIQIKDWRKNWQTNSNLSKIELLPSSKRILFTRAQDSLLGSIYEEIASSSLTVAQKDKKISIIDIDVSSTHELFAKYFCEALAKQVSDFYIETKSKKAKQNMQILVKQTDSIRKELNSAITGVAIANDNTFNLNPSLNIRRTPSVRRQVDVQANTAILTELVKQTELSKVTLRKETPLIQVIDRPILPLKYYKLSKLKGMIFGFFLAVFLTSGFIIVKRIFKNIILN